MTIPLSVSPTAVDAFAGRQSGAATRLGTHVARTDVSSLAPTFGLIGADFLAALGQVLDARRSRLLRIARMHAGMAASGVAASDGYRAVDRSAAAGLSAAGSIPAVQAAAGMSAPEMGLRL